VPDRPKDWLDIIQMVEAQAIEPVVAASELRVLIGDDERVRRLSNLANPSD
jgi:hypothetical protein